MRTGYFRQRVRASALALLALTLTACSDDSPESPARDQALRSEIQRTTETLYWIHLRLDTARSALQEADAALVIGETSAAGYHLAEALRALEQADDRVLELGQEVQQAFDLDRN